MLEVKVHQKRTEIRKKAEAYEEYMGRWSRLVAQEFIPWLGVPEQKTWLDVGCGTGALTQAILKQANPRLVRGIDPQWDYVNYTRTLIRDMRASFEVADVESLFMEGRTFDAVVSGLVFNFMPQPELGLDAMKRVTELHGVVGAYVWEYSGQMEPLRAFWDAATELDPRAANFDEGVRFTVSDTNELKRLFTAASLNDVEVRPIDVTMRFKNFEDYWLPFRGGQGPAPIYVASLDDDQRRRLEDRLRQRIRTVNDGPFEMKARALAVKGTRIKGPR